MVNYGWLTNHGQPLSIFFCLFSLKTPWPNHGQPTRLVQVPSLLVENRYKVSLLTWDSFVQTGVQWLHKGKFQSPGADPRMVRIGTGPPFWQINHANSAYFRLFLGYFGVISATRPPLFTYPGSSPEVCRPASKWVSVWCPYFSIDIFSGVRSQKLVQCESEITKRP